ncbi:MAG: Helix-turn-helix domain, partial [Gammaproteobacteria bacterium]|nr:Helix-turn-helix domain [Gammaproteobacteria bacterium]
MDKDLQEEERLPSAKSLGEYLKSARMAKQWNINDLVRRIKLPVYVVEVLEKDDYEAIEAKLFIKGYLRLYAKTVEANGHDFEALLREKGEFTSSLMEAKILNESVVYDPQRMR